LRLVSQKYVFLEIGPFNVYHQYTQLLVWPNIRNFQQLSKNSLILKIPLVCTHPHPWTSLNGSEHQVGRSNHRVFPQIVRVFIHVCGKNFTVEGIWLHQGRRNLVPIPHVHGQEVAKSNINSHSELTLHGTMLPRLGSRETAALKIRMETQSNPYHLHTAVGKCTVAASRRGNELFTGLNYIHGYERYCRQEISY